jgi:hypothetical protein
MNPFQLFGCAIGKHSRDRSKAVHDGSEFRSVCTGCGRQMTRGFHRWTLTSVARKDGIL